MVGTCTKQLIIFHPTGKGPVNRKEDMFLIPPFPPPTSPPRGKGKW